MGRLEEVEEMEVAGAWIKETAVMACSGDT